MYELPSQLPYVLIARAGVPAKTNAATAVESNNVRFCMLSPIRSPATETVAGRVDSMPARERSQERLPPKLPPDGKVSGRTERHHFTIFPANSRSFPHCAARRNTGRDPPLHISSAVLSTAQPQARGT